jgi:hypothetical protein
MIGPARREVTKSLNHKCYCGALSLLELGAFGLNFPLRSASYSFGTGGILAASPLSCRASLSTISAWPRQAVIFPKISIVLPSSVRTSPTSFKLEGKTTTVNRTLAVFFAEIQEKRPPLAFRNLDHFSGNAGLRPYPVVGLGKGNTLRRRRARPQYDRDQQHG